MTPLSRRYPISRPLSLCFITEKLTQPYATQIYDIHMGRLTSQQDRKARYHPSEFFQCPFWQYGTGSNSSERRRILGSVVLISHAPDETVLQISHLVLGGSSNWVVGRNVTSKSDILQLDEFFMVVNGKDNNRISFTLTDYDYHLYLQRDLFIAPYVYVPTAATETFQLEILWPNAKGIIDDVYRHVCGNYSFSDIKVLLQRNCVWSLDAEKYMAD